MIERWSYVFLGSIIPSKRFIICVQSYQYKTNRKIQTGIKRLRGYSQTSAQRQGCQAQVFRMQEDCPADCLSESHSRGGEQKECGRFYWFGVDAGRGEIYGSPDIGVWDRFKFYESKFLCTCWTMAFIHLVEIVIHLYVSNHFIHFHAMIKN